MQLHLLTGAVILILAISVLYLHRKLQLTRQMTLRLILDDVYYANVHQELLSQFEELDTIEDKVMETQDCLAVLRKKAPYANQFAWNSALKTFRAS
ncbi:hypothetical protein [Undibacterium rugosum]|uniref:Uncharacterized protein n=1 Tax=Undibacterium rugosum TaxID=2762291 RepID=A0A923I1G6_9BURK|nr:hypothetical protein [Undibacterium rugosum]MBC3934752.1 hypothetical protein [Undibacterium rugosum]MBR7778398.1 hypothetical protein [Undibacterium rugosum]